MRKTEPSSLPSKKQRQNKQTTRARMHTLLAMFVFKSSTSSCFKASGKMALHADDGYKCGPLHIWWDPYSTVFNNNYAKKQGIQKHRCTIFHLLSAHSTEKCTVKWKMCLLGAIFVILGQILNKWRGWVGDKYIAYFKFENAFQLPKLCWY